MSTDCGSEGLSTDSGNGLNGFCQRIRSGLTDSGSGWDGSRVLVIVIGLLVLTLVLPGVVLASNGEEGELPNLLEAISPGLQVILEALAAAVIPFLAYHVKLWLEAAKEQAKQILTAEQYALAEVVTRNLVLAAEQVYREGHGAEKKHYVLKRAQELLAGYGLMLELEQLDHLIEGLVWQEFNGQPELPVPVSSGRGFATPPV